MKNLIKILGFSFLGLLFFGMFFTILNKDKNIETNDLLTLSGSVTGSTGSILAELLDDDLVVSGTTEIKEDIEENEDKKLLAKIKENSNGIKKAVKKDKIIETIIEDTKIDITILDTGLMSEEEKIIFNNIKKEIAGLYVPNKPNLPGVDLETKIGKTFQVGVHSLKINDKTFTIKSGYIYEGDTIKQLLPANSRGCFKMEILSSKDIKNIGKTGYVCKKYLKEYIEVRNSDVVDSVITTKVGDIYSVYSPTIENKKIENKKTDNISVIKVGTLVEQVENEDQDANGCFKILVLTSYGENKDVGKVGYVCNNNTEEASFYSE